MWEKAKDFLTRAFTVIFVATIIIWFLSNLDFRFNMVANSSNSMLASIGRLIAPIFAPLGFGNWQSATSLIVGLTAKEAVVSTLAVLFGSGEADLGLILSQYFTPLTAFTFLTFVVLYMPCVAAMAATRRELGSGWAAALVMAFQTTVAWIVAFIVNRVGGLLLAANLNIIDIVLIIVVALLAIAALGYINKQKKKSPCGTCSACSSCPQRGNCADEK
jgi:ferrous iron transport protein B